MIQNKQEISLQVINENSFIYKIRSFFRKLFFNRKAIQAENQENIASVEDNIETRNEFIKYIKIETNEELLDIQKQLEKGKITIEELTEKQKSDLIELYKKQIEVKKDKLNNLKKRIINLRKKLQTNV